MAAIISMVGFAGSVLADTSDNQGAKAHSASALLVTADGGTGEEPANSAARPANSPEAVPSNDTCSNPTSLDLDRITFGTTVSASNDYRVPTDCFTGVGQIASTGNGLDVVFSFLPPADGKYSFRYVQDDLASALRSQSPVLYLTDDCPAPNPNAAVGGCIRAANRMNDETTGNGNVSEEIDCVQLTANTPYYLFFDDRFTANVGGPFAMEVTRCVQESEPNGTIAMATPYSPNSSCFQTGSISPAGDADFFSIGQPPTDSKIFAAIDGVASNNSDFEMRITNTQNTLGYDNNDGTSWNGTNSPIIAGVIADGNPLYARISAPNAGLASEPYHLYVIERSGVPQEENDEGGGLPGNDSFYFATRMATGYVKGVMSDSADSDCYRFVAHEGDNLLMFADNNPARTSGTITNVWGILKTMGGEHPANQIATGQVVRNLGMPGPSAGFVGTTPSATSNFSNYRARYTGTYMYCFTPTLDVNSLTNPAPSAYPLPYIGSITANCGPVGGPGGPADVGVTQVGPVGLVKTGTVVVYTITVTNHGTDIAQDVRLVDTLPLDQLVYLDLSVNDGFGGADTGCISLPFPGTAEGPIDCTNYSINPGESVTYTLTAQVANCSEAGVTVTNSALVSSLTVDPIPDNNSSMTSFETWEDGSCAYAVCDGSGCVFDACAINDHCDQGVCVADYLDCDDHSVCTADSCDPTVGCVNDSSQLGDLCFDQIDCTLDTCDPVWFCQFPPTPAGATCSDGLTCTTADQCNGLGACIGHSVCDDGYPCTTDLADETSACACTHTISLLGTICNDGNACTLGTVCDGVGGTVASCNGGTAMNCDDGSVCTEDSCDPASGCVNDSSQLGDLCDDFDGCTANVCDPVAFCVFPPGSAGTSCDDFIDCTVNDICSGGLCVGTPIVAPGDVATLTVSSGAISWSAVSGYGIVYEVVRGLVSQLPVGSGAGEMCLIPGGTPLLSYADNDPVPSGDCFWYVARARNSCGTGPYSDINSLPRVTGACPP